jgi:DNA-binding MarR family transcriptional regulator
MSDRSQKKKRVGEPSPGRYAYSGLDRVLHEKARLGILASLATRPGGLVFGELKDLCSLTDGNLSRHLQVLEEAGVVEIWKGFQNRRPQTLCRLTPEGRRRFLEYVAELERVIRDAAEAREPEGSLDAGRRLPRGWAPA